MINIKMVNLNGKVNSGEAVVLSMSYDGDIVSAQVQLNSYGSTSTIGFVNLTPEALREAADKLEQLMGVNNK